MKEKVILKVISNYFNLGLVLMNADSTGQTIDQVIDIAVQSALNVMPDETDVDLLAMYSINILRENVGLPKE